VTQNSKQIHAKQDVEQTRANLPGINLQMKFNLFKIVMLDILAF
jgi:hypothetical protein